MAASVKWWIEEDLSFWRRPSKMKFDYYRSSGELIHLLQIKPILFALSHHSRIRNLRQNNFSSQDAQTLTTEIYKTATTQTQFYLRSFGNLGIGISSSSAALSSVLVYRHCENVIFPTSIFYEKIEYLCQISPNILSYTSLIGISIFLLQLIISFTTPYHTSTKITSETPIMYCIFKVCFCRKELHKSIKVAPLDITSWQTSVSFKAPYKSNTCIPRWNDMETTVSTSF